MDKLNFKWEASSPRFSRKMHRWSSLELQRIMREEAVKLQITPLLPLQLNPQQNQAKIQAMPQLNTRLPKSKILFLLQI